MRVLMVSWEYPPRVIGGIAAHVDGLARAMARAGHDVVVLSLHDAKADDDATAEGVRVLRARVDLPWIPDQDLVAQMASANHQVVQLCRRLDGWTPEVIHAHDWLMAWAGDTLATLYGVPLVATIHATERGRHGGHLPDGQPAVINAVEWWLTYQAREVICCSKFMIREVVDGFELPRDKVHLVPNGVDPDQWHPAAATTEPTAANTKATAGIPTGNDESPKRLVLAWGRVQYEKGFQILAQAISRLRGRVPDIHCFIAGRGSYLPELQSQVDVESAGDLVTLGGFVSDDDLRGQLRRAGCVVIPSLYEPFGIVALEAMAAGAPVIVARTGGLAEIVEGTGAGLLFEPGNADDLARQIERVLTDRTLADELQRTATDLVESTYTWDALSVATVAVYERAVGPRS